jgi:hypothetical protein
MAKKEAVLAQAAYVQMMLHAAKFPARPVTGALLANADGVVVEAVPLFHTYALAPLMETAMSQLATYCTLRTDKSGLTIVGCYNAPEREDCSEADVHARALADKIGANAAAGSKLLLLVLDNAKMDHRAGLAVHDADAVSLAAGSVADACAATRESIVAHADADVFDFEEHLDVPARNWLPGM